MVAFDERRDICRYKTFKLAAHTPHQRRLQQRPRLPQALYQPLSSSTTSVSTTQLPQTVMKQTPHHRRTRRAAALSMSSTWTPWQSCAQQAPAGGTLLTCCSRTSLETCRWACAACNSTQPAALHNMLRWAACQTAQNAICYTGQTETLCSMLA